MRWKAQAGGIILEKKEEVKKRLGRSPDVGDAIAMCTMVHVVPPVGELR